MGFHLTKPQRLMIIIGISFTFFVAEISVGFYTKSLALVADAFHYLNDLIGFIVALVALKITDKKNSPASLAFGWQRANLLGAFFNGVFLLALGVSIFLQSLERLISLERIQQPKLVLIVGCVGLTLNIISASFLHEHEHDVQAAIEEGTSLERVVPSAATEHPHAAHRHENIPKKKKSHHDVGMMGVMLHVIGDAANNLGVIIAALVIWKAKYESRYYADPAVSMAIAFMTLLSALPLVKKTGVILLQSAPVGVNPDDVKHDIEKVPGVLAVHELHIWSLNQQKSVASAHIIISRKAAENFMGLTNIINECFHAYGVHSATIQPEVLDEDSDGDLSSFHAPGDVDEIDPAGPRQRSTQALSCKVGCPTLACEELTCCG